MRSKHARTHARTHALIYIEPHNHHNKLTAFTVGKTTTDNINNNQIPVINIKNSIQELKEYPQSSGISIRIIM
jgi:hypothetical protein